MDKIMESYKSQRYWIQTILFSMVSFVILLYVGFAVFLYTAQTRLIYLPTKEWVLTPTDRAMAYDEVWLTTSDGVRLSGWFVSAEENKGTILLFHGNGGNISFFLNYLTVFRAMGFNTFIIDYRGYGHSEGSPTEEGTYLDAESAWNYLVTERQISPTKIVLFGFSLGGGVAAWLAQKHPPQVLILQSTFTSAVDVAAEQYSLMPVRLLANIRYDTLSRLPQINCPVFIVHGRNDEVIPFNHAEQLFKVAHEPKEFLEFDGQHNTNWLADSSNVLRLQIFLEAYF